MIGALLRKLSECLEAFDRVLLDGIAEIKRRIAVVEGREPEPTFFRELAELDKILEETNKQQERDS